MPFRSDWGSARPTAQETGSGCLYCPVGDGRLACTAKKIPRGVTQTLKTEARYRVIYYHREKYAVQEMSTFFEVSRSRYYAWIKLVYQENQRIYGYRRVTQALRGSFGVKINHKTVLRLMQKMGLRCVARKRKVYKR
jgi:HTH-like domain